jgi:hypothetical protein
VKAWRLAWPALAVASTFVVAGLEFAAMVERHAMAGGTPVAEVRLSAMMAGLFGGGAVALVVGIAVLRLRRR